MKDRLYFWLCVFFLLLSLTTLYINIDTASRSNQALRRATDPNLIQDIKSGRQIVIRLVIQNGVLAVILGAGALLFWRKLRQSDRQQRGKCPVCGYDLRATPHRCPECGAVPAEKIKNAC